MSGTPPPQPEDESDLRITGFERLVEEAVAALSPQARKEMKNVAIIIEQKPRRKKLREVGIRLHETLLGLYEGIPLIRRDSGYSGVLPDKITIFQEPIEELSGGSREKLADLVREVVWHEIGHHFGLSDPELRALEKKRKELEQSE